MIVHVMVPLHRRSLAPDKIAEWMNHMLDPDHDRVQVVTVTDDDGQMLSWQSGNLGREKST